MSDSKEMTLRTTEEIMAQIDRGRFRVGMSKKAFVLFAVKNELRALDLLGPSSQLAPSLKISPPS